MSSFSTNLKGALIRANASVRLSNILIELNLTSIEDLDEITVETIRKRPKCGKGTINEFKLKKISILEELGSNLSELSNFPAMLEIALLSCNLSVRLKNILIEMNLTSIEDLDEITVETIRKRPKCGKGTINEFLERKEDILNALGTSSKIKDRILREKTKFIEIIQGALNKIIDQERRHIISKRIAGEITLQSTGDALGITRERSRQIEAKCIRSIRSYREEINSQILSSLTPRTDPLTLKDLEKENPWFEGINDFLISVKGISFFHKIVEDNYKVETIDDEIIFSSEETPYYQDLFREAKSLVMADREDILSIATLNGREDIAELLYSKWNKLPRSLHKICMRYLYKLLQETSELLTLREAKDLLNENYNESFTSGEVGNCLIEIPECYKFSESGWGLETKFGLFNPEELQEVGEYILAIMVNDPNRYWHCTELQEPLWQNPPKFFYDRNIQLNHWQINWVLEKFSTNNQEIFKSKRLVWEILSTNKEMGSNINQLLLEFLENKGGPITKKEVRKKIESIRGVHSTFQIHLGENYPEVVEINSEEYGLRDRDIDISNEEEKSLISFINETFKNGQNYIHPYELDKFIKENEICLGSDLFLVSRLLKRHNTQKIDKAKDFWIKLEYKSEKFLIINPKYRGEIPTTFITEDPSSIQRRELKKVKKGTSLSQLFD